MGMRFRFRKRLRLWPFYVVITQRGFSSWGIHIWRWTHNFTRNTHSFDTPGPGALYSDRRH